MRIQERIDFWLKEGFLVDGTLSVELDTSLKNDLKFLKAELQRSKNKVVEDQEAINIFVSIFKKQLELVDNEKLSDEQRKAAIFLNDVISVLLPKEFILQLYMTVDNIKMWIEGNVDVTKLKNKNQIIGIVKKNFPYVDGEMVKNAIDMMEA